MADFRIKTIDDPKTGMIFAEVHAEDSGEQIARSEPMYETHEEAEQELTAILKRAWPTSNPFDEDPTIGV